MRSLGRRITSFACAAMVFISGLSITSPMEVKAQEGDTLTELSIQAAAEGCVMLKNENEALPLANGTKIALFGRAQNDENYIFCGKGSGGGVKTEYRTNILEALEATKVFDINPELKKQYQDFCASSNNDGFSDDVAGLAAKNEAGGSQRKVASRREMDWTDDKVEAIKRDENEVAIVMISRNSGEDADLAYDKGSFLLTDREKAMLASVSNTYDKVIVLLNTTGIIDMSWVDEYPAIDSILYVWNGGQEAGTGIVQVLRGEVNPCGKLTDTIAKDYHDYPSYDNYGKMQIFYQEDIYVGYRYFETFAPEKVLYPFGYGLSYTTFETECNSVKAEDGKLTLEVMVTNVGDTAGKEVVQVYYGAPQGGLGNPVKELAAFAKTDEIYPGESKTLSLSFKISDMASYDDGGLYQESAYVLEEGEYSIYVGNDVKSSTLAGTYTQEEWEVVEQLQEAAAPVTEFLRYKAVEEEGEIVLKTEEVPQLKTDIEKRVADNLPEELQLEDDSRTYKLIDVYNNKTTMENFVAQMTPEQMGMLAQGAKDVKNRDNYTSGGASYFGGVRCKDADGNVKDANGNPIYLSDLYGIPVAVTADGPSGIKISEVCTMIPCGNVLGCTWNLELIEKNV